MTRTSVIEIARYGFASALGFAVDVAVLWLLAVKYSVYYPIATATAFVLGGLAVYVISIRYVFTFRRVENATLESASFIALGLIGLVVNVGIVYLLVEFLLLPLLVAKICASGVTFFVNYIARKLALFSPHANPQRTGQPQW